MLMRTLLAACLFFFLAGGAQAGEPGKPVLLVASPGLQGMYRHTTVVAIPAGDGYVGFIVNRATELRLATLFPSHAPSAKVARPVQFGGPEMANAIFAIVRGNPGNNALRLFGDVFLVADADQVDRVIEKKADEARYFAGCVAWQPGELAKEIDAGYWYVSDAAPDPGLFFRDDTEDLWRNLSERLGGRYVAI